MTRLRVLVAALTFSASGLVALTGYEWYTERAVIPVPGDVPTIGFGTTEGVKLGDRTTPPAALARAHRDVQKFEGALRTCVTAPLHQHEYDAYVSLAYNIGIGKSGVVDGFCYAKRGGYSTLVTKLNALDYAGACKEILRWNRAQGRVVRGLTKRRQAEYATCTGASQ